MLVLSTVPMWLFDSKNKRYERYQKHMLNAPIMRRHNNIQQVNRHLQAVMNASRAAKLAPYHHMQLAELAKQVRQKRLNGLQQRRRSTAAANQLFKNTHANVIRNKQAKAQHKAEQAALNRRMRALQNWMGREAKRKAAEQADLNRRYRALKNAMHRRP